MVAFVILILAPQGHYINHMQLILQVNIIFSRFFSKLHLWLHIRLLGVVDMVADATTIFLQFFFER